MSLRSAQHADRRWTALLIGLACASLLVTLPGATSRPLTGDEVSSAIVISKPGPMAALQQVARGESTPPLWYGLGWLTHAAGVPVESVRLLSAAAMAAVVVLTAVLARVSGLGLGACALAGGLAAFGDQFADHGAELRAYALFCLFTLVFALVLLRATRDESGGASWTLAAVVAAGTLTHYYFLFSVAAAAIWLATTPRLEPVRRRLLTMIALGLIPLALWVPAFLHQYRANRYSWIGRFSAHTVLASVGRMFVSPWVMSSLPRPAELIGLLLAVCGVVALWPLPAGRLTALLAVLPTTGAAALWWLGSPVFDLRNILGAAPFVAVAVAAAVARLPRLDEVAGAIVVLAVLAALVDARMHLGRTDFDRVSHSLTTRGWQPRDPIAVFGTVYGSVPLAWYLPGHPRLDPGRVRRLAHCRVLFVVAENARGRAWLRATSDSTTSIPAYGTADWAPPGPPFEVARVRLTPATGVALRRSGARIFGTRGFPGCVAPST